MAMLAKYDENVYVDIMRKGIAMTVYFYELLAGDVISVSSHAGIVVGEDAHRSGDASYDGWLFYSAKGTDYYPEDFMN